MPESTYLSREDSRLMRRALSKLRGSYLLEIGTGYGSNLRSVIGSFDMVVGTDICRTEGFEMLRKSGVEIVLADRATCFRSATFDIIASNPPYLPSERIEDPVTDGGCGGFDVSRQFLEEMVRVMKAGGCAVILLSSETDLKRFQDYCKANSLTCTVIIQEKLFFETLFVFELKKTSQETHEDKIR